MADKGVYEFAGGGDEYLGRPVGRTGGEEFAGGRKFGLGDGAVHEHTVGDFVFEGFAGREGGDGCSSVFGR